MKCILSGMTDEDNDTQVCGLTNQGLHWVSRKCNGTTDKKRCPFWKIITLQGRE